MAEATTRLKITAEIQGLDGLDKLKSSLRALEQSSNLADDAISKARKEILDFAEAGKKTEQSLFAQIDALKALRSQAGVGGDAYRLLSKDVKQLASELGSLGKDFENTATKAQTFALTLNQGIGGTSDKVGKQLNVLKEQLSQLKYGSEDYLTVLQRIQELQIVSGSRAARSSVIAANQAYTGATLNQGFGREEALPQMPNTTAALSQRVNELTAKLANLDKESSAAVSVAMELEAVQKKLQQSILGVGDSYDKLGQAEEREIRRAAKIAQIQEYSIKAPGVGGYRDPETGAMLARGSNDRSGYTFNQNLGLNYGPKDATAFNEAVAAATKSIEQIIEIEKRGEAEKLALKEKAGKLALEIVQKEWAEELKLNQEKFNQEIAQFDRQLQEKEAFKRKAAQEEIAVQEAKAARSKLIENVGLGVGFPLMFGGGPGAILGGGLGSFVGEGFAGQIVGSAIGQKLDEFTKSTVDFAKALREGGDAVGYLKETLGYLDPAIGNQISALQKAGQTAEAAKVTFEELSKAIGEENAKALQKAGTGWDQFTRDIKLWTTQITSEVLGAFSRIGDLANLGIKLPTLISLPGAPKVKEDSTTQQYRNQLELSNLDLQTTKDKAEAAKTILKDNIGLYTVTQERVALDERNSKVAEIYQKIKEQGKTLQIDTNNLIKAQIAYEGRINEITRQAQDEQRRQAEEQERKSEAAARKAKEEQDKAYRLEKDRAQIALQSIDVGTQELLAKQEIAAFSKSDLEAAKDKLKTLQTINQREDLAFNQRARAEINEAKIKGTLQETVMLISNQVNLEKDKQVLRQKNLEITIAELGYAERLLELNNASEIESAKLQGKSAIEGLRSGIASSLGQSGFQSNLDKLKYDQEDRSRKQILDRVLNIDNLSKELKDLPSGGPEATKIQIAIDKEMELLRLKRQELPIMDALEEKQLRLNEFTQKYGGFFDAISQGLTSTFDLLVKGTDNWGASLRNIAATVLQDIAKQLLKIYVIDQSISFLKSAISGINFGGGGGGLSNLNAPQSIFNPLGVSANGNVFAANGIVPYAMGGIVDRPTLFPFAKGIGLMGEAGPEAIIPLKRGADGRLGVAGGGGGTTVNVSVDAKGTSVQGDGGQSAALGRAIAASVQAELIKQKRPGGLLAA
jgi:hypothetical protein